jgi:hypothetical protein
MQTYHRIARTLALAALLVATALSSGCGFLCFADWQCRTECCDNFRCVFGCTRPAESRIHDAAQSPDFTDVLVALFPPGQLDQP